LRILAFLNAYIQGVSGGDVLFSEVLRQIVSVERSQLTIVTSKMGKAFCEARGLTATFKITSCERKAGNPILLYLKRILLGLAVNQNTEPGEVLYAATQFLPDVLPIFLHKLRNNTAIWVQPIYHLIPSPTRREGNFVTNFLAFTAQTLTFPFIIRKAELIFVLNDFVKQQLIDLGFAKGKIHTVGAGISLAQINRIPAKSGVWFDACFLGRLHPSKGIFDLPEIWKIVVSKKEQAKLALIYVGPENMERTLRQKIKESNLESEIVMFPVTGDAALSVVKSCRVFIFPSHEEGWGIAISEAMACGLPVVAYDLRVYHYIFKDSIVTVPMGDYQSFAKEIINLLDNTESRNILLNRASAHVQSTDWSNVSAKQLSLIKNALKKNVKNRGIDS
jgi:glycosyltransferase involved in cell wall biosynthesis